METASMRAKVLETAMAPSKGLEREAASALESEGSRVVAMVLEMARLLEMGSVPGLEGVSGQESATGLAAATGGAWGGALAKGLAAALVQSWARDLAFLWAVHSEEVTVPQSASASVQTWAQLLVRELVCWTALSLAHATAAMLAWVSAAAWAAAWALVSVHDSGVALAPPWAPAWVEAWANGTGTAMVPVRVQMLEAWWASLTVVEWGHAWGWELVRGTAAMMGPGTEADLVAVWAS